MASNDGHSGQQLRQRFAMTIEEANALIAEIQRIRSEREDLDIKSAHEGTPARALRESISAFTNRSGGGAIVLGIDEAAGFAVVGVHDVQRLLTDVANIAASDVTPPVRIGTTVVPHLDGPVVIIEVPETLIVDKPCYIAARGIQTGSFIRSGPSNRQMTTYEILAFHDYRARRTYDDQPVERASLADLDENDIRQFVLRLQRLSSRDYSALSYEELVTRFGIATITGDQIKPTLAGLLCFGSYPQLFHPQLRIVFVHYFGDRVGIPSPTGGRYLDNREFDGSVRDMIDSALVAVVNASPIATVVDSLEHRDLPLYPTEAIREAIVNAVVHRDYGAMAIGSHIQIELFSDRLEIRSPGGLFGGMTFSTLQEQQSTRNPLLMRFLQDMDIVENRGTGIDQMIQATSAANLPPPEFSMTGSWWFRVMLRRGESASDESPSATAPKQGGLGLAPAERRVLALFDSEESITNSAVQERVDLDRSTAKRILGRLVAKGLISRHGERRGTYYTRA
jgi:ATP-dependent DNA helicase RecG